MSSKILHPHLCHNADGRLCFSIREGDLGKLIFKMSKYVDKPELRLMTEWKFNQNDFSLKDNAFINNICVCAGHTTDHIIDYDMKEGAVEYFEGENYVVEFTMSIEVPSSVPGGACTFRCWNKNYDTFASCPRNERAEILGTNGTIAMFKATFNKKEEKWFLISKGNEQLTDNINARI